jgi:chemotaxis signal transduction protein
VEASAAEAWRQEPHYTDLKAWAAGMAEQRGQVVVKIGRRAVVILPDRHVDLGIMSDDEVIVTAEKQTPNGLVLDALKMKLDDPRIADLQDSALGAPDADAMGRSEP